MEPTEPRHDDEFVANLTACQPALAIYVRSLMPGDRAAEEVVQQANAMVWQKRSDFEPGTNFKAWMFAIARFEVLNHRKQQARDARLKFSDELEQTIASDIAGLDDDLLFRQEALQQCLKSLKPESRELLLMRYGSQETLAEFAGRVGRTVGGVKVTLNRLRNKLATCIERRMSVEGRA